MNYQATKTYTQTNHAPVWKVFPLLCPVREKDWLDGWEYEMIYSVSGFAEKNCVFATPADSGKRTIWYVTQYDKEKFYIEFVRFTSDEIVVKLLIQLYDNYDNTTKSVITYQYTALCEETNRWIETESDKAFEKLMNHWEKSINHYLKTGTKLIIK